ncbi:MAG: hypothetical protein ACI915_000158 [Gammaproteobacteria bacterium]|jgi:hypothetical protein
MYRKGLRSASHERQIFAFLARNRLDMRLSNYRVAARSWVADPRDTCPELEGV